MSTLTPIRVNVIPLRGGARQIVLSCSCVRVGRLVMSWESDEAAIAQLRADHQRKAPLCRHPWLAEGYTRTSGPQQPRHDAALRRERP